MSEIVFNAPKSSSSNEDNLRSQIENLQTTLASLNQQVIILQEAVQERDHKIAKLEMELSQLNQGAVIKEDFSSPSEHIDNTLTVVGALIKLYQFVTSPGKAAT